MAYNESSAAKGLTFLAGAWFSAAMTQRNIHRSIFGTANDAAPAFVHTRRVDATLINVVLTALVVVVVVLITTPTGAG